MSPAGVAPGVSLESPSGEAAAAVAAPAAAPAAAEPEVPPSDRGPSAAAAEEARQLEDAREKGLALVAEQARVEEQLLRDHARRQAAATGGVTS